MDGSRPTASVFTRTASNTGTPRQRLNTVTGESGGLRRRSRDFRCSLRETDPHSYVYVFIGDVMICLWMFRDQLST